MPILIRSALTAEEQNKFVEYDDVATANDPGIVKVVAENGITLRNTNEICINKATDAQIKTGTDNYMGLVPANQHMSIFYGLAKAAGDTSQSSSANAIGVYTEEAKLAIRNMLDVTSGESTTIAVPSTDPVIQASSNARYICGEVETLDFTPCSAGICEVIFTSGTTPTVLSMPQTVQLPEWFAVEANHIYEISVIDGVYGAVGIW